jgi:hypothetical protein
MYKLSIVIKQERPPELLQRNLNEIVRRVLTQTAQYWLVYFREKHFDPGAFQRYGYEARSAKYNAIKRRALTVKDWQGREHTAPKPPAPLVWSGSLRDAVLKKSPADFNIVARATANRQTVSVKIPIPHPLNPKNAGEIGRLIPSEVRAMQEYAVKLFLDEIEKLKTI